MGSVIGSIFGAVFMTLIPEILNVLSDMVKSYAPGMAKMIIPFKQVVFGSMIVGFLIFEPRGLAEIWSRIKSSSRCGLFPIEGHFVIRERR